MLQIVDNVLNDDERRLRVHKIISELHLNKCMQTTIKNLSGGERKRLALASVLLNDPQILLIDEPTSALDAYLAMYVMKTIRSMAVNQNKTIIVVIHQPTAAMYDLIDKVYVLVHGGRQAFFGSKDETIEFFSTDCRLTSSSLDGFIERIAAPSIDENNVKQTIADQYTKSKYMKSLQTIMEQQSQVTIDDEVIDMLDKSKSTSFLRQLKWLLWRSFLANSRHGARIILLSIRAFSFALIQSLLYFHLCCSGSFIQNVNALHVAVIGISITTSSYMIITAMPLSNKIGIRENHRGVYGIFVYYLSSVLQDVHLLFVFPFVMATIIYWMSGMDNSGVHYVLFVSINILSSFAGASFGQLISSFSSSLEIAVMIAAPCMQILILFNGFYLDLTNTSSVFRIFQYISPHYYTYSALLNIQWTYVTPEKVQQCDNSSHSASYTKSPFCKRILEHSYIPNYHGNVTFPVMLLIVFLITCHMFSLIILLFRANRSHLHDYWLKMKRTHKTNYRRLP